MFNASKLDLFRLGKLFFPNFTSIKSVTDFNRVSQVLQQNSILKN